MTHPPAVLPNTEWPSKVRHHTVTFVRHGEKNGGGFSADLTEKGRTDAFSAGQRITESVDLFLSSPSPRTVSTAQCIRSGNGSTAQVVVCDQLAEPGMGMYTEFRPAMRSFLAEILAIIEKNGAETVVATTHNYVVAYIANLFGCNGADPGYLSGITVNIETLDQMCEML